MSKQNKSLLKVSIHPQSTWAIQTHLADGLTLRLRYTAQVAVSDSPSRHWQTNNDQYNQYTEDR